MFITWDEAGGYLTRASSSRSILRRRTADSVADPVAVFDRGKVFQNYGDHVSLLKFIERNWNLQPLTNRSRDNYPTQRRRTTIRTSTDSPALDDLFDALDFDHAGHSPTPNNAVTINSVVMT